MHSILLILKLSPKGKNIKITNLLDVLSISTLQFSSTAIKNDYIPKSEMLILPIMKTLLLIKKSQAFISSFYFLSASLNNASLPQCQHCPSLIFHFALVLFILYNLLCMSKQLPKITVI